jgi:hypothetical protein
MQAKLERMRAKYAAGKAGAVMHGDDDDDEDEEEHHARHGMENRMGKKKCNKHKGQAVMGEHGAAVMGVEQNVCAANRHAMVGHSALCCNEMVHSAAGSVSNVAAAGGVMLCRGRRVYVYLPMESLISRVANRYVLDFKIDKVHSIHVCANKAQLPLEPPIFGASSNMSRRHAPLAREHSGLPSALYKTFQMMTVCSLSPVMSVLDARFHVHALTADLRAQTTAEHQEDWSTLDSENDLQRGGPQI